MDGLPGKGERTVAAPGAMVEGHAGGLLGKTGETAARNAPALLGEPGATGVRGTVLRAAPALKREPLAAAMRAMRRWLHLDPAGFAAEVRRLRPDREPDHIAWMAMAPAKAGLGERFGPAWEVLSDAAGTAECLPGLTGAAPARSAGIMFRASWGTRLGHVKRSLHRDSRKVMQELLGPVLSLAGGGDRDVAAGLGADGMLRGPRAEESGPQWRSRAENTWARNAHSLASGFRQAPAGRPALRASASRNHSRVALCSRAT